MKNAKDPKSYGVKKTQWVLVLSLCYGLAQSVAPVPDRWKPLAFAFFVFLCVISLWGWACAQFQSLSSFSARFHKAVIGCAFGLFIVLMYLGRPRPEPADHAQDALNFARGAFYPTMRVELYWGPTNGMERTLTLQPPNAGVYVIATGNTNAFPVYDLSMTMMDPFPSTVAAEFNKGTNIALLTKPTEHMVIGDIEPTNKIHFRFAVNTRAGGTLHNFNYVIVGDRWEHSNNVVDIMSEKVILTNVSRRFAW